MSKHTPEPWKQGPNDPLWITNGAISIAFCVDQDLPDIAANARRIIACINACAGLSTEALEAGLLKKIKERLDRAACAGVELWPEYIALSALEGT